MAEGSNTLPSAARDYRATLDEMRKAGITRMLSTPALNRLFGIGYALGQLQRDLDDLIDASREVAGSRMPRLR